MNTLTPRITNLGLGLSLVFLAGVGYSSYKSNIAINRAANERADTRKGIQEIQEVVSLLKDAETGQRGFLLTTNPSYLEPYREAKLLIFRKLNQLKTRFKGIESQEERLAITEPLIHQKLDELAETIRLAESNQLQNAMSLVRSDRGKLLMDQIRTHTNAMLNEDEQLLARRTLKAEQAFENSTRVIAIGSVAGFVIAALLMFFLNIQKLYSAAALEASEMKFRLVMQSANDAIITSDKNGKILSWNRGAERIFCFSEQEIVGKHLTLLGLEEICKFDDSKHLGKIIELTALRKDQSVFPVELSLSQWKSGTDIYLVSVVRDITDRSAEAEKQRRLFETVLDQMPAAVIIGEAPSGKLVFASKQINQIWRHSFIESKTVDEYSEWIAFHRDGRRYEGTDWPLARAITTGEIVSNEDTDVLRGDGTRGVIRLSAAPVRNTNGKIVAGVVTCEDMTERKKTDAERSKLLVREQAAQEASRLKSEFLANMSHEIRTPINGVIGMTGLLLDTPLNKDQKEYTEIIRTSADSLLGVINDILDFSKVESGKMELESIDFELASLVQDVQRSMGFLAMKKGIKLSVENLPQMYLYLKGDPGRLRQILINLISNAIKFTAQGNITLTLSERVQNGDQMVVRFEVKDTGIGISKSLQRRIFQPFSQADASTTRKFGGTGLGLSICKSLVELMKGQIGVESQPDQGSTFWFTATFGKGSETIQDKRVMMPARAIAPLSHARILIAEDNPVNQKVAIKMLEKIGYRAEAVANGKEVLDALKQAPYNLVLMDCQMPEMDGYEATARIRATNTFGRGKIPIVAMTANALKGDRERCLAAGMDDYVSKPISSDKLAAVVQKWLQPGTSVMSATDTGKDSVIDLNVIENLRELASDEQPDFIGELLALFAVAAPKAIAEIEKAAQSRDLELLKKAAHILKSSSANLGALRLSAVCERLEAVEDVDALLDKEIVEMVAGLRSDYEKARSELETNIALRMKKAA